MGQDWRVGGFAATGSLGLQQECPPVVNHVTFIWNIAESLRGPFKPSEYGSVVLPFTVLRRLDAVLADTKPAVLDAAKVIGLLPERVQVIGP